MLENNLGYSKVKDKFTLLLKLDFFRKNIIYKLTYILIFLKLLVFLALTHNNTASYIDIFYVIGNDVPIFVYLSFTGLFTSFAYLLKGKARIAYLMIFNIFLSALCMIDTWYYRAFGSFTTLHLLSQTANLEGIGDSVISFIHLVDFIFIIDIAMMFFVIFKYRNLYKMELRNIGAFFLTLILSVGCLSFVHYWYDIKEHDPDWKRFFPKERSSNPKLTLFNLSFIGYHVYDVYAYYKDSKPYILSSEEEKNIQEWFKKKAEKLPDNKYKGMFKGKNLIFIQVESLEKFVLNQKINGKEITPNLNKLLNNSLYFSNFYEQTNRGNSSDADLLANTSVYPLREGSTFFRYPDNTYNSMPYLMKGLGYDTIAIHPDKGGFWNWMPALYAMGFDSCIDSSKLVLDEYIGLGLSDESYFKQIRPIIKELRQPFYAFMVTLTSHVPFEMPEDKKELGLEESLDKTKLGGYFESIHYTDKHLGNFISSLDEEGLLDNTVVVIYGDHTGVHKYYSGELSEIEPSEEWWFSGYNQIPLIIYSKGMKGEEISINGGHVDILPTVSYLMGVDEEYIAHTAMGRNLLKTNKDFVVLASGQYIGDHSDEALVEHAKKGLDIADKILRSNYFKGRIN